MEIVVYDFSVEFVFDLKIGKIAHSFQIVGKIPSPSDCLKVAKKENRL